MGSYNGARSGLLVLTEAGNRQGTDDLNQARRYAAAVGRWLAGRLGGEGLHAGGAAVIGDITSGTQYPAFEAVVYDDAGGAWYARTTSPTAITFLATSGTLDLYLVPAQLDPQPAAGAAAVGGLTSVLLVACATANAPAHALKLGSGSVTASAFTSYTPVAGPGPATLRGLSLPDTAWGRQAVLILNLDDGTGATLTTGLKDAVPVPADCEVVGWQLEGDQTGSLVVDLYADSLANWPATAGDSLIGTGTKPALSSAVRAEGATVPDWQAPELAARERLAPYVVSATNIVRAQLAVFLRVANDG